MTCTTQGRPGCDVPHSRLCGAGILVLLALVGLVVAGAVLLGKRGRRDAMRADAAVRGVVESATGTAMYEDCITSSPVHTNALFVYIHEGVAVSVPIWTACFCLGGTHAKLSGRQALGRPRGRRPRR